MRFVAYHIQQIFIISSALRVLSFVRFLFCVLFASACIAPHILYAAKPVWDIEEELNLSKDEVYTQIFSLTGVPKELKLSWTLYKNYGLVVHLRYDKFPYQFVLYTDYKRKSFTLPLSQGNDVDKNAYMLLSFREFDDKEQKASLGLFIMLPQRGKSP